MIPTPGPDIHAMILTEQQPHEFPVFIHFLVAPNPHMGQHGGTYEDLQFRISRLGEFKYFVIDKYILYII